MIVFLKIIFEKVDFVKSQLTPKKRAKFLGMQRINLSGSDQQQLTKLPFFLILEKLHNLIHLGTDVLYKIFNNYIKRQALEGMLFSGH